MSTRTLRIAQIAPLFESVPPKLYGGTERVVHNLTRGLLNLGHKITVFCSGDSTTPGRKIAVHHEALRLASRPIADAFAYQIKMLGEVFERADEFDIIHNHYDYPLLPLMRMSSTPLLSTMHGRMDGPDISHAFKHFKDAPLISISNAQTRPQPKLNWIKTVPHGINVTEFRFQPRPGRYLAFLGRFSREKRPDWAIEIAYKTGIPLKIAAKISEVDRPYFEECIKNKIDGKFIEYIGEISESEKSDFLGNALALLFPIDWPEPFGLVMIEAMACGTPVLTRPMGSVPEVILDGKTGYVREKIDDLALLAESAGQLNRFFIRRYVEERFSIARMTEEYLDVYRKLVEFKVRKPAAIAG